ncbi:MAG: NAD-dependent epimerase/dehydratase family protein, partial [Chloroflexota bacterium]|nr:NAD-dependent epimerase/dehydratase family protein [Chloroflexota bacterium]
VLVTGATGAVGPRIVQACLMAGWRVRVFALDAPAPGLLPDGVEVRIGDVTDSSAVAQAMQDSEAVIHLAALLHIVNPSPELREKYERINVGGTATVVDAAIKVGVKRVVLASTIAVYGPSGGRVLDEESVTSPDTFYGQTKLAAEKIVLTARRTDGQPLGTVLRFGAIYGSRIKGNYQRLVHALSRGRFIPIGDGCNRRTLVYDKDVARAAVLAMQHPVAAGKVYNVTDGQFNTIQDINLAICAALGRKPPRLSIPIIPVRLAAGVLEDVAGLIGLRSPIARAAIDKYIEDVAVDSQRIQVELGFMPQYDLRSGWQETIQELRKSGEL